MTTASRTESELVRAVGSARLTISPWPHSRIASTFTRVVVDDLAAQFPAANMRRCSGEGPLKSYQFHTAALEPVGAAYRDLYSALTGAAYRGAMSALTGIDLGANVEVDVDVWQYGSGDWLGPHVDKPDKLATHVIHVAGGWEASDGGSLRLFDGAQAPGRIARCYAPTMGSSTILMRSEVSWHDVEAVTAERFARRTITATFRQSS